MNTRTLGVVFKPESEAPVLAAIERLGPVSGRDPFATFGDPIAHHTLSDFMEAGWTGPVVLPDGTDARFLTVESAETHGCRVQIHSYRPTGWAKSYALAVVIPAEGHPQAKRPKVLRRVVLESPYTGTPEQVARNIRYARACIADSLSRGEAPIASHLLYTQPGVLRDEDPEQRAAGIAAGHAWSGAAEGCVVYADFGISAGMRAGYDAAERAGLPLETRHLFASEEARDAWLAAESGGTPMQAAIVQVCAELREMLLAKNRAYGNSAGDPVRVFSRVSPREQILVRMDDKLSRIMRGQAAGEDAPWDLAGYLVLLRCLDMLEGKSE